MATSWWLRERDLTARGTRNARSHVSLSVETLTVRCVLSLDSPALRVRILEQPLLDAMAEWPCASPTT